MQLLDNGNRIVMPIPVNMHAHFREGKFLDFLVENFIKYGWRGYVQAMPNTNIPILTGMQAISYITTILGSARAHHNSEEFRPLVSMQITPKTNIRMLEEALAVGVWLFKIYPFNVTTNSEHGVLDYRVVLHLLKFLATLRTVRCYDGEDRRPVVMLHPESPQESVEGLYKEKHFIDNELQLILDECPTLFVSLEHISTEHALRFMEKHGYGQPGARSEQCIVATVPVQYLCSTLDDLVGYSRRSQFKIWTPCGCKPMLKMRSDTEALVEGVTSGQMKCLLAGNDDAAHLTRNKAAIRASCGTANTWASLSMLVDVFLKAGKADCADDFLTGNASRVHKLSDLSDTLTLFREDWVIPESVDVPGENDTVVPWMAGETLHWRVSW